jgi:hypothetical protein
MVGRAGASVIAGVLFLRFWRDISERLFLWFALAFWMFALNWGAVLLFPTMNEARYLHYLPRLLGFILILVAIVETNRSRADG